MNKYLQKTLLISLFIIKISCFSQCSLPNCLACSHPYQCTSCIQGLSCCQDSCVSCVGQNNCTGCVSGYFLNNTIQICQLNNSCLQNTCDICKNNICNGCIGGFVLDQWTRECVKCPVSCAKCTVNGTCLECMITFYLSSLGGTCEQCQMSNCLVCLNAINCTKCNIGYVINTVQPICVSCPFNCVFCSTPDQCEVCAAGYYLSTTQKCKPCASSCTTCYGSASNCTTCNSNLYFLNNQCVECFGAIPFCASCLLLNNQVQCISCASGMSVEQNACKLCKYGCTTCNSTNCFSCLPGYFLYNNSTCLSCNISQCSICQANSICISCNIFYYLSSNKQSCLPCPPNCYDCDKNGCLGCIIGYSLYNGLCMTCPPNCQSCTSINATCHGDCQFNFFAIYPFQDCLPCPLYCIGCFSEFKCINCAPGAYMTNNFQCFACPVSNCYTCGQNGNVSICSICNSGYYVSQTGLECLSCLSGCFACINSTQCYQCQDGYYFSQGQCLKCIQNCSQCTSSSNCVVCLEGFYRTINSICVLCIEGCSSCQSQTSCQTCSPGYYLDTNQTSQGYSLCFRCTSPCLYCMGPTNCTTCLSNYTLVFPGVCVPCPQYCLRCQQDNGYIECIQCLQGYSQSLLNNTVKCSVCPSTCHECQTAVNSQLNATVTKCISCPYGAILLQTGQCLVCGSNNQTLGCSQCNNQGQCVKCFSGFQLIDNLCINISYSTPPTEWGLIGALIGVGILLIILIVLWLYLRRINRTKKVNVKVELVETPSIN